MTISPIDLTKEERACLAHGFCGPRPGSNFFPMLEIKDYGVQIPGEKLEALVRAKVLIGSPVSGPIACIKGGNFGPYGDIPDIEMSYKYFLADANAEIAGSRNERELYSI